MNAQILNFSAKTDAVRLFLEEIWITTSTSIALINQSHVQTRVKAFSKKVAAQS